MLVEKPRDRQKAFGKSSSKAIETGGLADTKPLVSRQGTAVVG